MNDPINPGEGWRILKTGDQGELICLGDQEPASGFWKAVFPGDYGRRAQITIRRRLEKTQEQKDEEAYHAQRRASGRAECGACRESFFAALAYARKGEGK